MAGKAPTLTIAIELRSGVCRWCGCTDVHACDGGCFWVDRQETLCSSCQGLDRAARSRAGRRRIADVVHNAVTTEAGFSV